jgi:hypothetical protein
MHRQLWPATDGRLALQHDVLLEHVPATVGGPFERANDRCDVHVSLSEHAEDAEADCIAESKLAIGHTSGQVAVHVLEMHMADP